jgi:hypothetical protein
MPQYFTSVSFGSKSFSQLDFNPAAQSRRGGRLHDYHSVHDQLLVARWARKCDRYFIEPRNVRGIFAN